MLHFVGFLLQIVQTAVAEKRKFVLNKKKFHSLKTSLFIHTVILYGKKFWSLKMPDKSVNSVNSVEYSFDTQLKITHSAASIDPWNKKGGLWQCFFLGISGFRIILYFFSWYLKDTGLWGKPCTFKVRGKEI